MTPPKGQRGSLHGYGCRWETTAYGNEDVIRTSWPGAEGSLPSSSSPLGSKLPFFRAYFWKPGVPRTDGGGISDCNTGALVCLDTRGCDEKDHHRWLSQSNYVKSDYVEFVLPLKTL